MSLQTAPDIPLIITIPDPSPTSPPLLSAERRISPSWTIGQLKAKLEPVTGIPPSVQRLRTRGFDGGWVAMEGEERSLGDREWGAGIRRGGEIEVSIWLLRPFHFVVLSFGGRSIFESGSYRVFGLYISVCYFCLVSDLCSYRSSTGHFAR
jgi:Ubiquitin-like domain